MGAGRLDRAPATVAVVAAVVLFALAPVTGVAAGTGANQPPLADAGLDQSVERNATVYLDAGGSQDVDGDIDRFSWSIDSPDGTETTPACATCERTEFRATQVGTYEVTVTVTDDDGATSNDTLYVEVSRPDPPSVSLDGPDALAVDESGGFEATVSPGDAPVSRLVWRAGGDGVGTESVTGDDTDERTLSFDSPGTRTVTVTAVDSAGNRERASSRVDVAPVDVDEAAELSESGGSSSSDSSYVSYYRNGADAPQFTIHNLDVRTAYDFSLLGSRTEEALSKETIQDIAQLNKVSTTRTQSGELQSVQITGEMAKKAAELSGSRQANRRYTNLKNKVTLERLSKPKLDSEINSNGAGDKKSNNNDYQAEDLDLDSISRDAPPETTEKGKPASKQSNDNSIGQNRNRNSPQLDSGVNNPTDNSIKNNGNTGDGTSKGTTDSFSVPDNIMNSANDTGCNVMCGSSSSEEYITI